VISSPDLGLEATVAVQAMVIEQLREANARLVAANGEQASLIAALNARVAELERRLGRDSPTRRGHRRRMDLASRPHLGSSGVAVGGRPESSPARRARTWPRCPTRTRS
jgi:uncharacterized coiled-coil protein SlyX